MTADPRKNKKIEDHREKMSVGSIKISVKNSQTRFSLRWQEISLVQTVLFQTGVMSHKIDFRFRNREPKYHALCP